MPMDPQLAAIYGTNSDEGDVEKLAAAELAEKLAADEEVDTEGLTEEEANELAAQILAAEEEGAEVEEPEAEEAEEKQEAKGEEEGEEEEQQASGEEEAEETEEAEEAEESEEKTSSANEAQEKLAEADYLGRVMAHAYTQELRKIASAQEAEMEKKADDYELPKSPKKSFVHPAHEGAGTATKRSVVGARLKDLASKHGKKALIGAGAVGAAAGGVAAYKHFKGKKKKGSAEMSALDTLAVRRAEEIIAQQAEQEKTSASESQMEALSAAVDQRAYEMLVEAGYIKE